MAKSKIEFACKECGDIFNKWSGQCSSCGSWNSLEEIIVDTTKPTIFKRLSKCSATAIK